MSKSKSASCGHESKDGHCILLCDDYVDILGQGYCYLHALNDKLSGLNKLGKLPRVSAFQEVLIKDGSSGTFSVIADDKNRTLHYVLGDSLECALAFISRGVCTYCKSHYYCRQTRYMNRDDDDCRRCGHKVKVETLFRGRYLSYKIGLNPIEFTLRNLLSRVQPVETFTCPPSTLYISDSTIDIEGEVKREEDAIRITIGTNTMKAKKHEQRLKNFVHDYVAGCWKDITDQKLSLLGVPMPEGKITPDCIIVPTNAVLELGTCAVNNVKVMESMYRGKEVKYKGELKGFACQLYVLIVSPSKVLTNLPIDQWQVDELTKRMRMAKPLETEITRLLGEDIFQSEWSETMKLVKHQFETLPEYKPDLPDVFYRYGELKWFETPPDSYDMSCARKILEEALKSTEKPQVPGREALESYLSHFNSENSRMDRKRVTNLPFLIPRSTNTNTSMELSEDMPDGLKQIWEASSTVKFSELDEYARYNSAIENADTSLAHLRKRESIFNPRLSEEQKQEIALSGLGAKKYDNESFIKDHQALSKKSFHPATYTGDIESFVSQDLLRPHKGPNFASPELIKMVRESKELCTGGVEQESLEIFETIIGTELMQYCFMMNEIFIELSYCYKHWTGEYKFMKKILKNGVEMVIYNPKNVLFVSWAFPVEDIKLWDTGRLGPKMYRSNSHYFTDFSSFDNSQLEHFMKFAPYIGAIIVHLQSVSESNPSEFSTYTKECIPNLLLLYMNNKVDAEELVSSQRYLFMKVLEDVGTSPYTFVERLPSVMRSRLTVYLLKRTISLMDYYHKVKISKIPRQGQEMILYDYVNIRSLFSSANITLNMKINEFYFGYVISKERNIGKDKTFKVLSKLIEQEQEFRRTVRGSIFTEGLAQKKFCTNKHLLKVFSHEFKAILEEKFGMKFKSKIYEEYIRAASMTSFGDLATLKASARDHSKEFEIYIGEDTADKIYKILKEANPHEERKRPFVLESITHIIKEYEQDSGHSITHVSQLAPWCLKQLMDQGYFDSDQFNKSQHCGEREIHVLEIKARIVQYFTELLSRVICGYFPSETTMNPETKDHFVKSHYAKAEHELGKDSTTCSKSADAKKWCQLHHSSHFMAFLMPIMPDELKSFFMAALSLWPRKRLSFPIKQVASLQANLKTYSTNDVYCQFRSDFEKGTGMFVHKLSNLIHVISGMFQGILHTTSSLYHTMIQEVMKRLITTFCTKKLNEKVILTVVQGSDDSGQMLTFKGKPCPKTFSTAKRLLLWKERVTPWLSVICNEAKSSIGTHDLIEYNSEWSSRHRLIKPTFRWVSAALQVSVTERFIDRIRILYGELTECLTGGASTLECSVIQLFQGTLHYMMMGFQTQKTSKLLLEDLVRCPEPMAGFFPMDFDICAGLPGVEFQLFSLAKHSSFGYNLKSLLAADVETNYQLEELPNFMKVKDLRSVKLGMSSTHIYNKIVERLPIETLEDAIQALNDDPYIMFTKSNAWKEEQHNLVMKVFSPGVKESISNRSSLTRLTAASAYLQVAKCFTYIEDTSTKYTLPHLISILSNNNRAADNDIDKSKHLQGIFPFYNEFETFFNQVKDISEHMTKVTAQLRRTSKTKVVIFQVPEYEFSIIEMCKRAWFGISNIPLSANQFVTKWNSLMNSYKFLSPKLGIDGFKETCSNLEMNAHQTKTFLEGLTLRTRSVTLHDSTSKGVSAAYSMSRIYWPGIKLLTTQERASLKEPDLRSSIFGVLTFWFTRDRKIAECKRLLSTSKLLESHYEALSSNMRKLKIMRDFMSGGEKIDLIQKIFAMKQGTLGYFTQVQSGLGSERKGRGVWSGNVCGVSLELHMEVRNSVNTCTGIIVSNLNNTLSLALAVSKLIDDFNLKISRNDKFNGKTSVWFGENKKFVFSGRPSGVPVVENANLKFHTFEDIETWDWYIDISNQNLRLRVVDNSSPQKPSYTILSDTFTSKDWIPENYYGSGDPLFDKWVRGESCPMKLLEDTIGAIIPCSRKKFLMLMKSLPTAKNDLDWDLVALRRALSSSLRVRKSAFRALESEEEENIDYTAISHITSIVNNMDLLDEAIEGEITNWAELVEAEQNMNFEMVLDEEEYEQVDTIIDLLNTGEEFYETVIKEKDDNYQMPTHHKFFYNIEVMAQSFVGKSVKMCCEDDSSSFFQGLLGQVVSFVTNEFRIGRNTDNLLDYYDWEDISHTYSETVSDMQDLDRFTREELDDIIDDLKETMMHSGAAGRRALEKHLRMYKRMRELKVVTPDTSLSKCDYNKSMVKIYAALVDNKKTDILAPVGNPITSKQIMGIIIDMKINDLENVTEFEKLSIKSSLAREKLTHELLNFIAYSCDIKIQVENYIYNNKASIALDLSSY